MTKNKKEDASAEVVKKTVLDGENIWNEIKLVQLDMFALPNQFLQNFCTLVSATSDSALLKFSAAAVLPAMEARLNQRYTIELADKYLIVKRKNS